MVVRVEFSESKCRDRRQSFRVKRFICRWCVDGNQRDVQIGRDWQASKPGVGQAGRQADKVSSSQHEGVQEGWLAGNRAEKCWGFLQDEPTRRALAEEQKHRTWNS